ncbi:DUF2779 domain-containing protein [Thermosulfurimonas dismutans]|uniref:DUF2779 domain-containing protein n=1 Tax=Thermosulfurimonas dismutans TaxID=999894 RepID=A0A179D3J5_9BACT|nr:DUF2779 domain-containing protein [Thermosulfurimonas dismutans]OAQ20650.1 hypothetical protein TDIS_1265 [Thermosulfurimonas dismutans]
MRHNLKSQNIGLSKSRIMSYLQCPKRLWLEVHKPELKEENKDELKLCIFWGNKLNEIARTRYPGGILIEYSQNLSHTLEKTKQLINENIHSAFFEPAFAHQGLLVRVDILKRLRNKYELIEVKSAKKIKDYYLDDCAIQWFTLQNSGIPVTKVKVAYINENFEYRGDGNYGDLLITEDVTEKCRPKIQKIPQWIDDAYRIIASPEEINQFPGSHCNSPVKCPFQSYCKNLHGIEFPIWNLPRITNNQHYESFLKKGVYDIRHITEAEACLLSEKQKLVWECTVRNKEYFDPTLREKLRSYTYPRFYLDFETVSFVVPVWERTRPYQHIPFQYSCHIETAPGVLEHREYVDLSGNDPRREFVESLITLFKGTQGPIFVYWNFEGRILSQLAQDFPEYREDLESIKARLVDLCKLLNDHYYHPDMKGSWSLKSVAPVVIPGFSYEDLEISHGSMATHAYLQAYYGMIPQEEIPKLERELKRYCGLDTQALYELVRIFSQK